ncbi:hypothetical protein HYV49_04680 [Candidatus Pacearchaeota archaeon]|nr:hypothetical protein [Candidatus Pacearchaeota archaeon]
MEENQDIISGKVEGDVVLCTVDKIEGITVFVTIDKGGTGSIVTSEIAPGRIRNIRDYVVPNKKIVCKVLKVDPNGHVHLSLRRVTAKERKEVMDAYNREKAAEIIFKIVLKDKSQQIIKKIKEKYSLDGFVSEALKNQEIMRDYFSEDESEKILHLINKKKPKEAVIKRTLIIKCQDRPDGIIGIKNTLSIKNKALGIRYLGGSKFMLTVKGDNYKILNNEIVSALKEIESRAKKEKCLVEILKK